MKAKLTFQYDRVGDILYINKCPSYDKQKSEDLGDDVVARLNPKTGVIETLEVFFFSKRLLRSESLELPILADLRLAGNRNMGRTPKRSPRAATVKKRPPSVKR